MQPAGQLLLSALSPDLTPAHPAAGCRLQEQEVSTCRLAPVGPALLGTQGCVGGRAEVRTREKLFKQIKPFAQSRRWQSGRGSRVDGVRIHNSKGLEDRQARGGGAGLPRPRCQTFIFPRSLFTTAAELNLTRNAFKEQQAKRQASLGSCFPLEKVGAVQVL